MVIMMMRRIMMLIMMMRGMMIVILNKEEDDHDLYITGAVCQSVCLYVTKVIFFATVAGEVLTPRIRFS